MPLRFMLPAVLCLAGCSSPAEVAEKTGVEPTAPDSSSELDTAARSAAAFAYSKQLSEAGGGKMDFSYSWPKEAASQAKLAEYLRAKLDRDFAETKSGWESSFKDCPADAISCRNYSLAAKYEVVADLPGYLSLSNAFSTYTGGAHGMYGLESLVWDRKNQAVMDGVAMFRSPAALGAAIGDELCSSLDAARVQKGMEPAEAGDGFFDACPGLDEATVLVGSSNKKTFDRITVWYGPYVAGSYAEGAYELDFPMTTAMLEAVKPAYRAAFSAKK
ncbi:hypothetical protein A6F68_01481 [Tsuneonella dongtanensis]|uniref:Deacetylase PdaC domain-containing protein n=1 Tax=Tsuneonella dongtanensis TaxID=692370 RepID=A0A1B2ACY5_9SPHN|nr:DUF4163 domain-containing protein [Tsuneonella dongtanensis]ANY19997.1 hypothetical protein A6F68_01481 [Tsuneonella dongtanensis]